MNRWGWTGIIFELCNNDITKINYVTKMNVIEVFNWLSYNKEKNDLINKKMLRYGK